MAAEAKDDAGQNVVLVSHEGTRFPVPLKVASMSELVAQTVDPEELGADDDDDDAGVVPLVNVKGAVLEKILEYCRHHVEEPAKDIPVPLPEASLDGVVSDWDKAYADMEQGTLFDVMLGANFMMIKPLVLLCQAKVASVLKGKKDEELRSYFHIENDFTPEEEQDIKEENTWATDEPEAATK